MSVFQNINLPEINSASDMKKVKNYLAQMDENIRYAIENIDEENITKKFIDDLTVRHLNITNGDNSIIGNPDVGFQMLKGTKIQLSFDINTGEATFGGSIIGGSIKSDNYEEEISGMLIDLTNGTLFTPKTKILEDGSIETNGIIIKNGIFDVTAEGKDDAKIMLSYGSYSTHFSAGGISSRYDGYAGEMTFNCALGQDGLYIDIDSSPYRTTTVEADGISTPSLSVLYGATGNFITVDGKMATFEAGILTGLTVVVGGD